MNYSVQVDGNLITLTWFGLPSVEGVKQLEQAFEQVTLTQRRKFAFVTLIHPQATPEKAPPEVRNGVAKLLSRFAHRLAGTVVIYEAPGFKAAATRTIIATINLLSRSRFPSEVHSQLDRGVAWIAQQLGPDAPSDAESRIHAMLAARSTGVASSEARP